MKMWTLVTLIVLITATANAEPECDDLHVVGWSSAARTSSDGSGWTVVFSGKVIPCDGVVSQWSYWATVSQPFRAIVWRPTSVATQFTVVGINEIPAGPIDQAVVYTVPKNERIEVRQGDVIGLGWSNDSPRTTWVVGGAGAAQVRWYQDSDPSDLQIGDTATATGAQDRSWSFSALVTGGPTSYQVSFNTDDQGRTIYQILAEGKALLELVAEFPGPNEG